MSQPPREPTPPTKGGGGGGGSRNNTPVLARYAVLQQRQQAFAAAAAAAAGGGEGGAVLLPTLVHGTAVVPTITAAAIITTTTTTGAAGAAGAAAGEGAAIGGGGVEEEPNRSSTPARLSRVLSPLKGRAGRAGHTPLGASSLGGAERGGGGGGGGSGVVMTMAQQQQQAAAAEAALARRRVERRSRRKLRRWANDRLVAVAQLAPGGAHLLDAETGELVAGGHTTGGAFAFFDALDPQPTQFTTLMAAEHQEVRDRFLQGYYGPAAPAGGVGKAHRHGHRHRHAGGQEAGARTALQEAEARFLRMERRLRGVLTQIVASDPAMEQFLAALETLLRAFLQGDPLPTSTTPEEMDTALARTLLHPLKVVKGTGGSGATATLVLPLRNSAFLRLLVHGCAQYYGLKSRSEDVDPECRAVLVTRPDDSALAGGMTMTMRAFVRHSRLEQGRLKAGSKGRRLGDGRAVGERAAAEAAVAASASEGVAP